MQNKIENPILRGFHPDPSIIRVKGDYYLATSTFEWWPGVRLYHSANLKDWEQIEYPLNRVSQLDLRGVEPSWGIWAPDLSYHEGTFYLVYTIVKAFYCNMYDTENYLVTADNIHGPWSEPIALNNFGFDPSLFHDDNGKKYLVSMVTDHRIPKKYAGRLVLQEFDINQNRMKGQVKDIYKAEKIFLEGPHIFKRNGWYYLFSADTGTGELHGQTMQRARDIWGPYEMFKADFMERTDDSEAYSIITSRHHEDIILQKSGHCDLVETPNGEWYAVHLCGRVSGGKNPGDALRFPGARRYMIGRETAIQKMCWTEDDWLVMECGGNTPQQYVDMPQGIGETADGKFPFIRDDFEDSVLNLDYQSLRIPMDERYISLTARLEFSPTVFKQMAGLIIMYDTENYLYLHISYDEDCGKCITLLKAENKKYEYLTDYIQISGFKQIVLKLRLLGDHIQFFYGGDEDIVTEIGPEVDATFLSDEACNKGWFTGTMIGICCQDLTGEGNYADFDYFEVKEL